MGKVKLLVEKTGLFLDDAKGELKKVTWPAPKQALVSTGVVILMVIVISIFLGLIDLGLARLVRWVLG